MLNFSVSPFKSRYHEQTSFPTFYRNPVSGKDLYEFTRRKAPQRTDKCDLNYDTITTIVAPFTICPKILIDKRQANNGGCFGVRSLLC